MRRLLPFVGVAVLASALTAVAIVIPAQADDGAEPKSSADGIAEFEACMKEHGFDLSGGKTEIMVTPGEVTINGKAVDAEKFRAAERECGPPLGLEKGLGFAFGVRPLQLPDDAPAELRERMERMEACLAEERASA
jgi:hypothetical protein